MAAVLFIDANQYLGLYGLLSGKKLLDLLQAQKADIFLPAQIVDEVLRNKLGLASTFLRQQLKDVAASKVSIPDHLLGIGDGELAKYRKTFADIDEARAALFERAQEILTKISQSEDEVSTQLASVFQNAVAATVEENERARLRKENGNPPGKRSDPLGDQIAWEQVLSHLRRTGSKELWLITRDRDYLVKSGKLLLPNALLYRDLADACGGQPQVHCYEELAVGLTEFAKKKGASNVPTDDEVAQFKNEINYWNANTAPTSSSVQLIAQNLSVATPELGSPTVRVTQGSE